MYIYMHVHLYGLPVVLSALGEMISNSKSVYESPDTVTLGSGTGDEQRAMVG